jgi:DNA uptake protein ComE-like DNA-binding protein
LAKVNFNKRERNGLITVLVIGFCCFVCTYVFREKVFSSELSQVDQREVAIIDSLLNKEEFVDAKKTSWVKKKTNYKKYQKEKTAPFNPNKYSVDDWQAFGFSPKQAASLVKYKQKIKGFKSADDLQDAFVVNDYMFRKMEKLLMFDDVVLEKDYIQNKEIGNDFSNQKTSWDDSKIDVNSANADGFKKLYGIGEKLSVRIVKFRDKLGGFVSVHQLKEVYGVSDSLFDSFETRLEMNEKSLKKIKINSWSELELKMHPYIDWKKAKLIFNYRKDWSRIADWNILLREKILSKEDKEKLEPYIEFD